jgi:positive regulator of sigma E activity
VHGSVVSTLGTILDCESGQLRVEMERRQGCGACAQKSVCNPAAEVNSLTLEMPVKSLHTDSVAPGDQIVVSLGTTTLARMIVVCYLVPAVLMLMGAYLGAATMGEYRDLAGFAGAALGLMVGCGLLRLYDSSVGWPWDSERTVSSPLQLTLISR